ncbi:DUF4267 domain-containing protein [Nocardia sp. NPDC050712]|uniref:DUF4267 domain-containing protein n=1 Tax=Nocardia sp. NPDC050712 TaxID=3155518 RepID=UPI0033CFF589
MLTPIAYGLAVFLVVFVLLIGARFLLTPQSAAVGFGVPAEPDGDTAYLTVKGLRDFTSGVIVLRHGGTKATAFGIHFATAVVVLISAALLFIA